MFRHRRIKVLDYTLGTGSADFNWINHKLANAGLSQAKKKPVQAGTGFLCKS